MAVPGDAGSAGTPPPPNIVPSIFVSSSWGAQPQIIKLRDSSHNLWHLKAEKLDDCWYFTDGWNKFVKDNKITGGDVLVYESPCDGWFNFKILSPSGSEEGEVERLEFRKPIRQEKRVEVKTEVIEAADDVDERATSQRDHHPRRKKTVVDAGAGGKKEKKKRYKDFYGEEVFNSGEVAPPVNPYFVATANRTRPELYIPVEVVKCYNLEFPETMVIVDSEGRRFQAKRRTWKDGRVLFYGGWKAACRVNKVQKDDKIICEFITEEGRDLEMRVSFVRAK